MPSSLHPWDLSPAQAIALQNQLRAQVELVPLSAPPRLIGGADLSFDIGSDTVYAGIVVLSFPDLKIVEECGVRTTAPFPYVPGLLSFRESPPILEVWDKLRHRPDVLVFDGQGTAHPRRFGIACHLGLWLDLPTVGCAKTLLCGRYEGLGQERGSRAPLVNRGDVVGEALRTKTGINPVFVSPGHRCDGESAVALMLQCNGGYKIPEPTRRAHDFVNRLRRGEASLSGEAPTP